MPQASAGNTISDSAQVVPGVIQNSDLAATAVKNNVVDAAAAIAMSKLNLAITNAEVAAGAAIVDTKLANISTAGKVDGAAITGLANIPAGAGVIPAANVPTQSGRFYSITADILAQLNTEKLTSSGSAIKLKQFTLAANFPTTTLRITFDLTNTTGSTQTHAQIYKNGVAYGALQDRGFAGYATFSQDLSFTRGDTIELWGYQDGSTQCGVKNFRIMGQVVAEDFNITNTLD